MEYAKIAWACVALAVMDIAVQPATMEWALQIAQYQVTTVLQLLLINTGMLQIKSVFYVTQFVLNV